MLAARFERVTMGNVRFRVKRLPMIVARQSLFGSSYYSLNNCLIEVYGDERHAYIPVPLPHANGPARKIVDNAVNEAQNTLTDAGFCVHPVSGRFPGALGRRGSLHCAVKVLERRK